jgi:hypothetical protein
MLASYAEQSLAGSPDSNPSDTRRHDTTRVATPPPHGTLQRCQSESITHRYSDGQATSLQDSSPDSCATFAASQCDAVTGVRVSVRKHTAVLLCLPPPHTTLHVDTVYQYMYSGHDGPEQGAGSKPLDDARHSVPDWRAAANAMSAGDANVVIGVKVDDRDSVKDGEVERVVDSVATLDRASRADADSEADGLTEQDSEDDKDSKNNSEDDRLPDGVSEAEALSDEVNDNGSLSDHEQEGEAVSDADSEGD